MAPKRKVEEQKGEERNRTKPRRTYTPDPVFTRTTRSKTTGTVAVSAAPEVKTKQKKKGGAAKGKAKADGNVNNGAANGGAEVAPWKTVIVEHCKQCNSFKTRALQVKDVLEKFVPGTNVILNPDKPRRGCFEIREDGGEIFVSLLEMKRPFKAMKDLNMDYVISDIAERLRS